VRLHKILSRPEWSGAAKLVLMVIIISLCAPWDLQHPRLQTGDFGVNLPLDGNMQHVAPCHKTQQKYWSSSTRLPSLLNFLHSTIVFAWQTEIWQASTMCLDIV